MLGLRGLNKRTTDIPEEECYLTPHWAICWLQQHWTPRGAVICDPCAGDGRIGQIISYGQTEELFDLCPLHPDVRQADFRVLTLPPAEGGRTIITNPPYRLLPEFVRWALVQPSVVEVVVLTRFGFLCAEQGARAWNLVAYYQPAKRLAFELTREEGQNRLERRQRGEKIDVHADSSVATGYRMSSTGVDHGWAVYRPNYTGKKELVIEAAEKGIAPW